MTQTVSRPAAIWRKARWFMHIHSIEARADHSPDLRSQTHLLVEKGPGPEVGLAAARGKGKSEPCVQHQVKGVAEDGGCQHLCHPAHVGPYACRPGRPPQNHPRAREQEHAGNNNDSVCAGGDERKLRLLIAVQRKAGIRTQALKCKN